MNKKKSYEQNGVDTVNGMAKEISFPNRIPKATHNDATVIPKQNNTVPKTFDGIDEILDPFCDPKQPQKISFHDITSAAFLIKDGIERTPCPRSTSSDSYGMDLYLKKDFLQYTGSFKERGARHALLSLTEEQKQIGVISASLGNHAQALSYHGWKLNIPVTVIMPKAAPIMKIQKCRRYKASVVVEGKDMAEAKAFALKMSQEKELLYINGYDHPHIMAGQGTIGLEILEQVPNPDAIIIPVGGGGLIAGIATATKALSPKTKIIGVESAKCASFSRAMENNGPIYTPIKNTLADGLAVPKVGYNAYVTAVPLIDKMIVVEEEWIALAILRLVEEEKCVVEGAGAAGLAAILSGQLPELQGKKVVVLLCGGNIDTTVFGRCLERGLAAEGRLVKFNVEVSDRPGGVHELCEILHSLGVSIKDIMHERAWLRDIYTVEFPLKFCRVQCIPLWCSCKFVKLELTFCKMPIVQTVLGAVDPNLLGRTLTHEHISLDFEHFHCDPPEDFKTFLNQKISIENLGYVRQYPYSSLDNVRFYGEDSLNAALKDIELYKKFGGGTIVENSSHGLKRNIEFMVEAGRKTGVHIVAGTGHYVHNLQQPDHVQMTVEQMSDLYSKEIITGVEVEKFGMAKCGFIGEVGSVYPIHDFEKRAIKATGEIQEVLGCGVSFHPGRDSQAPFEIMRLYLEAGGKANKCVMSHLDRTIYDFDLLLEFSKLGCYLQYDLFGSECSLYQLNVNVDMPSDAQRINNLMKLIEEGLLDRILMSHDIHTKHRLTSYGGHGYHHVHMNVLPRMFAKGLSVEQVEQITVTNPTKWLEFNI